MNRSPLLILSTMTLLTGCATATEIELEPGKGGVVAVQPPRDPEARQKAKVIMESNCGGKKPVIVKEGFVKVGETSSGEANTTPTTTSATNIFTGKTKTVQGSSTKATSTTRDISEWRIVYKCE